MECSTLRLEYLNGPLKGNVLEYLPEFPVRVGRVMKGNTLAIKDPGISSKHLLIQYESGKWMVQDLDSSNGTFLNSVSLTPFHSYEFQDNDTIKLGEVTSLLVRILLTKPNEYGKGKRRRGQPHLIETKTSTEVKEEPRRARVTRGRTATRTQKYREEKVQRLGTVKDEVDVETSDEKGSREAAILSNGSSISIKVEVEEKEKKHETNDGSDQKILTLGEWFDVMETNVRNQIIEESEEAIEEMKNNAKRVCDYYLAMKERKFI